MDKDIANEVAAAGVASASYSFRKATGREAAKLLSERVPPSMHEVGQESNAHLMARLVLGLERMGATFQLEYDSARDVHALEVNAFPEASEGNKEWEGLEFGFTFIIEGAHTKTALRLRHYWWARSLAVALRGHDSPLRRMMKKKG